MFLSHIILRLGGGVEQKGRPDNHRWKTFANQLRSKPRPKHHTYQQVPTNDIEYQTTTTVKSTSLVLRREMLLVKKFADSPKSFWTVL